VDLLNWAGRTDRQTDKVVLARNIRQFSLDCGIAVRGSACSDHHLGVVFRVGWESEASRAGFEYEV